MLIGNIKYIIFFLTFFFKTIILDGFFTGSDLDPVNPTWIRLSASFYTAKWKLSYKSNTSE